MKCKNCGTELRAQLAITEKGWIIFHECIVRGDTEKEVIANFEQLQNTSSNSDYAKCKEAYIDGYETGHNDTVESCYGYAELKADDWVEEHFA
jgi:hypothetical protein